MAEEIENKITVLFEGLLKRIAEERGGDLVDCNITELDFSGPIFELESLDGLRYISWKSLKAIDVSNNSIDKLGTVLSKFVSLQTIIATNNLITKVDFGLPKLTELDLSRNYLKQIPDLSGAPRLERLLLGFNEISGGFHELSPLTSLVLVDLSNNRINIGAIDMKNFLEILKGLTKLDSLRIYNNPFCDAIQQYEFYFISKLLTLNSLNNERITKDRRIGILKSKIKPLEQVFQEATTKAKKLQGKEEADEDGDQMPKLEKLHENMRQAKNSPTDCLERFKKVVRDVEKIVHRPEERFVIFKANTPEEQGNIRVHIDSFLQEAVMMIEDMPTMRTPVLRLLASLSEVEEANFGQKCILTLQDLFVSGPEIAKEIEEILRNIIIPKIKQDSINKVSKDLLRGVIRLCKDHDITEMLQVLIPTMADWMRAEVTLEEARLVQGQISEEDKRETHTYMLSLVACAANKPANAEMMSKRHIGDFTAKLIKVMERETETSNILGKQDGVKDIIKRLKFILKIIENMTKNYPESGRVFISEEIHQKLLREIWDYLIYYKANGYTFSSGSGNTESIEIMYYKLLTAYINTLAGLCKEDKCVQYINTVAVEIRDEILDVSIMPKTDPLLLTSIIELINALLSSPYFTRKENIGDFKHYVTKMQKMLPFLPYLGGKKYKDICMLSEKYAKGTIVGQEPILISSLTNKYLHRLFIAIIQLIQFFSSKGTEKDTSEIKTLCMSISITLNANHREDLLFNCLEIPNDSVRLAVVKCLDRIPVNEIDIEETGHIVRILGSYKNLGVGKTEEVLSQIFMLLSKILVRGHESTEFRDKFGEMVITECLDILCRNQQRDLRSDDEENSEKMLLTMSGVYFLKVCSIYPSLHRFMENIRAEETMRIILKAEESFSKKNDLAVDIERTWIGMSVEPLLMCFSGSNHLLPDNEITYRVLQRIANVLSNAKAEETYEITEGAKDQLDSLKDYTIENSLQRDKEENSAWPEVVEKVVCDEEILFKHHDKFKEMKGIPSILTFLLGRSSMKCIEIEKELSMEFGDMFEHQHLLYKVQSKVEVFTKDYKKKLKIADDAENKPKDFSDLTKVVEVIDPNLLIKAMQEQDLNSEENSYILGSQALEEDFSRFDTPKIKLRAKILATFLRCLNAALELGSPETRLDAVEQLKELKNLRALTKLCATTGWKHSTLGAKFLRVTKHILKLSPLSNFRPQEDVIMFEILAQALTQILKLIRIKIINSDRVPLDKEDYFFIKELSGVGAYLCNSVYTFQWSNEIESVYKERTSIVIKSVQEQAAGYLLEHLIPITAAKDFIEILFYDMTNRERMMPESYKKGIQEVLFMEIARKSIGDILSTYLALNENCKYRVLEFCKIGVIFHEKVFNVTYLQDLMNRASTYLFAIEISKYMKKKWMDFKMTQDQVPERTVGISWGDYCEKGSRALKKMLMIISCRCIYLLNPCTSPPCPLCGEERFCPQPPTYKEHIEFSAITKVIIFDGISQMLGLEYRSGSSIKGFTFISKFYDGSKQLIHSLISIKEEVDFTNKMEDPESIETMPYYTDIAFRNSLNKLLMDEDAGNSIFEVYCSVNPETSLASFMEGLRVFKRGVFCVVTNKNIVLTLEINFKNWIFNKEEEETLITHTPLQNIFSITNAFNLERCTGAEIKDEAFCNFYLEIDKKKNILQFGDDYSLELFQRHVMTALYKTKGGKKVTPRVNKANRPDN